MGTFLTSNKSGYFWFLMGYLQDKNVYVNDARILPYTPGKLQTYVDFHPQFPVGTRLSFEINGNVAGYANIVDATGFVYVDISVPKNRFDLVTKDPAGNMVRTDSFVAKNYAMFIGVMAQSYDERRASVELIKADQRFQQMRSGRLYQNLGVLFDFPPPPGWTVAKYRAAILGGCGPGFISSFWYGGTQRGIVDTIKSITCQDPQILPPQAGIRWVVRNRANSFPTDPTKRGFFVTDLAGMGTLFTPPHYRALVMGQIYEASASRIIVPGSTVTVSNETIMKRTNSFLEGRTPGPYDLSGKTFQFSIEEVGVPATLAVYTVSFPLPTTNATMAASTIRTVTGLTDAVHASPTDLLRLGVYPEYAKTIRITVLGGTAIQDLGFYAGDSADVSCDALANPNVDGNVLLEWNGYLYVHGVDFGVDPLTGEVCWMPSTSLIITVPPAGAALLASYQYRMIREIEHEVDLVRGVNDIIEYDFA